MKKIFIKTLEEEGYSDKSLFERETRLHTEDLNFDEEDFESL